MSAFVKSLSTVLWFSQELSYLSSQNSAFFVRERKIVSSEKQNKTKLEERERTKYREWLGGGEGRFTIPTRRAHRTKREKHMIKKTDQKKKGR